MATTIAREKNEHLPKILINIIFNGPSSRKSGFPSYLTLHFLALTQDIIENCVSTNPKESLNLEGTYSFDLNINFYSKFLQTFVAT